LRKREYATASVEIASMSARTDVEAQENQASTGITPDTLGKTLEEKLEASHVDIADLSGMPA